MSLSLGKAGLRTLVALLDKQYGPAGVHLASVTVAGAVAPGTAFDPDDIAAPGNCITTYTATDRE
ncbi:hypothetical protein [Amycolatopsis sp. H20-H5]|uniref:hypothetical protein n=1 Tax=Amycolatopsis sp. H20-H5 TaxID=3046309 RepID=UPI002DB631DF|nr:hypothetical protein [Amycolatopsis sp. H20-H5]MEC3981684.1 hypothetical protein [Amycolatopsis sp. H20-H5]